MKTIIIRFESDWFEVLLGEILYTEIMKDRSLFLLAEKRHQLMKVIFKLHVWNTNSMKEFRNFEVTVENPIWLLRFWLHIIKKSKVILNKYRKNNSYLVTFCRNFGKTAIDQTGFCTVGHFLSTVIVYIHKKPKEIFTLFYFN